MSTSMPNPSQSHPSQSNPSQSNGPELPQPPTLHWGIVLALSIVTFSVFYYFWAFRQALFIKKIDKSIQKTVALRLIGVSCALMLFNGLLGGINALTAMHGGQPPDLDTVGMMMRSFQYLFLVMGTFLMRKTLTDCYGVQMNGVLTWLFGVFYVQFHMTRIAKLHIPLIAARADSTRAIGHFAPTQL